MCLSGFLKIIFFYSNYAFNFEGMFTLPLDLRSLGFLYVISTNSSVSYTLENIVLNYLEKKEKNFLTYTLSHTLIQQLSMSMRWYYFKIPFLQAASKDKWTMETRNHEGCRKEKCNLFSEPSVDNIERDYKPIQNRNFSTSPNCLQFQQFSGAILLESYFRGTFGFLLYTRDSITNIHYKNLKSNNFSIHKITVKLKINVKKL